MKEQDRLAVSTDPRLAVAEHARALFQQVVPGGLYIIHLVTQMVDPALAIAFEELRDRRTLAERFEQFDLRIRQFDKDGRHAMLWLRDGGRQARPQPVTIDRARRL